MNQKRAILAASSLSGLYAITDSTLLPGTQLFASVEAVLRGGCRVLQYRNKQADEAQQLAEAQTLRHLCERYGSLFIINDDVSLALAAGADGVHVGQSDMALADVRKQVGERMLVGASCHNSIALALQAEQQGASYVAFGRFFNSHTKPDAPAADPAILPRARQQLRVPLVAIGGITRDNAPQLVRAGANMVAVIHDLFSAPDPHEVERRARCFAELFPRVPSRYEQV